MWLFTTALFGGLMLLSTDSRRRMIAVFLIGCIAILGVSPPPAQGADLPALHNSRRSDHDKPDDW